MTESEYNQLVDDFGNMVVSIPELAGFVAIIQSLLKVAKIAYPLIQVVENNVNTPATNTASNATSASVSSLPIHAMSASHMAKMTAVKAELDNLTSDDILRAGRSLKLMIDISKKIAHAEQVQPDPNSGKDFDGNAFFNQVVSGS